MKGHNRLRIIGGQWRSRILDFIPTPELRPTPDRVRETLFNWLQPVIHGAHCLDLFAGSGILGFESVSRGAEHAVLVDNNLQVIATINANSKLLKSHHIHAIRQDAFTYINSGKDIYKPFNIIFLDPPFKKGLILPLCIAILENNLLAEQGYLYIETEADFQIRELEKFDSLKMVKSKKIANINIVLLQFTHTNQ